MVQRSLGALYWIDVKAPALYRTEVASLETVSWALPSEIGGFGLKPDAAGAFLALRNGVKFIVISEQGKEAVGAILCQINSSAKVAWPGRRGT